MEGEIFGQQEAHRGAAIEGATREDQGEQRDVVDGVRQGEEEESQEEGSKELIPNLGQEVDVAIRPEFMIFRDPNGFIQHWLIEKNGFTWGDPDDDNVPDAGNEHNTENVAENGNELGAGGV